LANAASRGGNLLMNIGPKGDGAFDSKDLAILNGIGKWMDKNGESIYGTEAGPLPLQSWGVSTLKGNKIYLHVFEWPKDGKLYVAGQIEKINKAYLLTDPAKKIKIDYLRSGDLQLGVAQQAPDSINTVIVLEFGDNIPAGGPYFIVPNVNQHRLLAFDAQQTGKGFSFGDGKTNRYYVEGWKEKAQRLSWTIRTIKPGNFQMIIKYLAPQESSGGSFDVVVNRNDADSPKEIYRFHQTVVTDPKVTTVITRPLGNISLPPGTYSLEIIPVDVKQAELMKLLEVQLMAVDKTTTK
jgi:hypothetical protein